MKPFYEDSHVTIYHGDCREVLPTLDPVETCITDPPYGLAFMGKAWDHAVPDETYWRLVRNAVLPGGMLLAFGGTRLWHWLAVGVEQAGWEIRDTLMYLYGSGFPKSHSLGKAVDRHLGHEREVVGERQAPGMAKENVHQGAQNRTTTTFPKYSDEAITPEGATWDGWGSALKRLAFSTRPRHPAPTEARTTTTPRSSHPT